MQTVSYTVDGYGGYVADVSYDGEPAYPEAPAPYHPAPAPYHPAPAPYHPAPPPAYPRPSYPVQPHAAPSVVKPKVAEAPAAAAAPAEEAREAKAIEPAPAQPAQAVVRTTSLPRIAATTRPASRFRPVPAASNSNVRRYYWVYDSFFEKTHL